MDIEKGFDTNREKPTTMASGATVDVNAVQNAIEDMFVD